MAFIELEERRRQFEQVQAEAQQVVEGLSEAQFNWRPGPRDWSIAECLGHLIITGETMCKGIERALEDPRTASLGGRPPFRYPLLQRWIVKLSGPTSKSRFKAAARFLPASGQPVTAILPTFLHLQRKFILLLERAENVDWARVKVVTPIGSFYRFSLGAVFAQSAAHALRHLAQARRVRENPRFPA